MQAVRVSSVGIRGVFGVVIAAYVLTGAFAMTVHAGQARTPAQGVYAADQATRGAALFKAQCVACHGEALEGAVGPALAGPEFLASWAGHPVTDLADKIEKTMPLNAPGTLTRPQAIDIVAYVLQVGKFPAGRAALAAETMAGVSFPGAAAAAAPVAAAGALPLAPVAN